MDPAVVRVAALALLAGCNAAGEPFPAPDRQGPDWSDGAGAYSGSWVRQVTGAVSGFWLPCSPGAIYHARAQVKRTAGTGPGGRLNVAFYPTLGSFSGVLGTTSSAYVTASSWTEASVTSAAAPAGTNAVHISYEAGSGDTCQFDSLYARRVAEPEIIDSQSFTPTGGTGWTVTFNAARRVGPFVHGRFAGNVNTGAFTSILTMPAGSYPALGAIVYGTFTPGGGLTYPAEFYINTNGVVSMNKRHDGTSFVAPPAPNGTDSVAFDYLFVTR